MPIAGDLPNYMRIGRGSMSGPVTGGYCAFTFGPNTPTGTGSAVAFASVKMPFQFRVEAIYWRVRTAPGTAGVLTFEQNSSDATGGTNLLTAASINIVTSTSGFVSAETTSPTSLTSTSVNRTIDQGQFLVIAQNITNTETAVDLCFGVIGFPMTHVHADPDKD
jgi:hypothetical protein